MGRPIPVIISIDVEPDGFQLARASGRATTGYDAAVTRVAWLRAALERSTGRAPSFGWYFRMDPQIGAAFGRADHLVSGFGDRVAALVEAGDHVGLHTHPVRWSADREAWVHDVTDPVWIRQVYASSFDAFERCFGMTCARHRVGAALCTQDIVDAIACAGATVELALEPVRGWGVETVDVRSGVDASPLAGKNTDCSSAPRHAYRASRHDFLRQDGERAGLAVIPLTSTWLSTRRPAWQTFAGAVVKRRGRPRTRMLYPALEHSPQAFWDVVLRQVKLMRRPYINLGVRTDAPDGEQARRAWAVLEALADHPLADHLELVDPLDVLPDLLGERDLAGTGRSGR